MSFDADEEILQDFLVEAGELLESLSEQLVDLENRPDDSDLLNAIFRGFHTVKGGAGFLQLEPLVDLCHAAENAFDCLRNGQIKVTTQLMDVVLQAFDQVNEMFASVHNRVMPNPAPPELIDAINSLAKGEVPEAVPVAESDPVAEEPAAPEPVIEEAAPAPAAKAPPPSDDGFEFFTDDVAPAAPASAAPESASTDPKPAASKAASGDEITDDEFEALLDQLHGAGSGPSVTKTTTGGEPIPQSDPQPVVEALVEPKPAVLESSDGEDSITDDEFEALLDQLHGAGKGPTIAGETSDTAATPQVATDKSPEASAQLDSLLSDLDTAKAGAPKQSAPAPSPTPVVKAPVSPTPKPAAKATVPAAQKPASAPAASKPATPNKDAITAETTVRVDTKRLDEIMNMVGELVLVRNRLVRLGLKSADEAMAKAVANLDVVTADLQTSVMKTRMQPIKKVFGRFPRVVRDLARNLKKEINLELVGEDTDLDKNLVEALADPLVHLVRNSVDHGVELPDVREAAGKPRAGKVILAAQQEGDHIVLSITDDGGGMDPQKLKDRAASKGLMDQDTADRLSDVEAYNLIFAPGFSTKDEISDVSGRGVGMDVVKTKISQLNGQIDVQSKKGEGTVIAIKVPLTLAIMPTLMVMLEKQTFALPLVSVNEIFHLDLSSTNVVDGQEVVIVRDKALPLFHLKRWLVPNGHFDEENAGHVVIVSVGTQHVGFVVDQLIGQEEVVIKPLGRMLHGTPGMAGATITGDGRIALILDVPSMLKRYVGSY